MGTQKDRRRAMTNELREHTLRAYPTYCAKAGQLTELRYVLTHLRFLEAKLRAFQVGALIEDYALDAFGPRSANSPLLPIAGALRQSAQVLDGDPDQLPAQLLARIRPDGGPEVARLLTDAVHWRGTTWLRPLVQSLMPPAGPLLGTLRSDGHSARVTATDPAGATVVSGGADGSIICWDLEARRPRVIMPGHEGRVTAMAVTPDARRIVSSSDDGTVRVWDAATGAKLLVYREHLTRVTAAAVTPDGRTVASGGERRDGQEAAVRLWDARDGTDIRSPIGHTNTIRTLAVAPCGRTLASGDDDGVIRAWDLRSGSQLFEVGGHVRSSALAFTSDSRRIVSAGHDLSLRCWDAADGRELCRIEPGGWPIEAVLVMPDDLCVLAGSADGELYMYELQQDWTYCYIGDHSPAVTALAAPRSGEWVLSASEDSTLRLWRVWPHLPGNPELTAHHSEPVSSVAISSDGRRAISVADDLTASSDRNAMIWSVEIDPNQEISTTGRHGLAHVVPVGEAASIRCVPLNGTSHLGVSRAGDNVLRVWNLQTGACDQTIGVPGHGRTPPSAERSWDLTPDGIGVVTCGIPGPDPIPASGPENLVVWDLATGAAVGCLEGHCGPVAQVSVTPDGTRVVASSPDGGISVWELRTGRLLSSAEDGPVWWEAVSVTALEIRLLCVGKEAPERRRWRYASDRAKSDSEVIRVWTLGQPLRCDELTGHSAPVTSLALSADGQIAVSGSDDRTLLVWDLGSSARIGTLSGHTGSVASVAITDNGRYAVSGDSHGTIIVWDIPHGARLASFTAESPIRACAIAGSRPVIVAGDEAGKVHLCTLEVPLRI